MANILVVDDSLVDQRKAGKILEDADKDMLPENISEYKVVYANHGKEALEIIAAQRPDMVLTDMQMPEMDGMELVEQIKINHPRLPVILMTAHGSETLAIAALRSGAASYVPKQQLDTMLLYTVEEVLELSGEQRERQRLLDECWMQSESHFMLPNDMSYIAPLIGQLQDNLARLLGLDDNDQIRVAVALREALSNAMIHGNLEVGSEMRETDERGWYALIAQRQAQAPFNSRHVYVTAEESRTQAVYIVRDEGGGFATSYWEDPTTEENLDKVSGRGLLLIRTFMDYTEFNAKGNELKMVKRRL